MSFQKIFVLGAGAIGSSIGALLSVNNDVTLIGNKAHIEAINSHGLIIEEETRREFRAKAETAINEIQPGSLILLTTKAHDAVPAIRSIKRLLKSDTVVLVLQNGLEIRETVQKIVGAKGEFVRGLVLMAAEFLEPGKIKFWNGQTIIEATATGKKIASLFNESGLRTKFSDDIRREEWGKMVINCVINPLTTILKVRNNEIITDSLEGIRRKIIEECIDVAKAEGVILKSQLEKKLEHKILSYTNYSSMCQDIMRRKKTEIDFLNGAIVKLGKKHGIQTPVNETLVGLIKFSEATK